MESVGALPEPLRRIEIPTDLSVTRLVTAGSCLLRAAAPLESLPFGPSGPRAEFGKLAHTLSELAVTGGLGGDGVPANVTEAFDYLLEQARIRLSATEETRRYADCRSGSPSWSGRDAGTSRSVAPKRKPRSWRGQVRGGGSEHPARDLCY